jgi:transposase-like protein
MASLTTTDPVATLPVSRTSAPALLKTDAHGRVRATPERRAAILAEFERSGVSAAQFARLVGLKYSTFAQWVQRHRRAGASSQRAVRRPAARSLQLVEAVLTPAAKGPTGSHAQPLRLHLPGGGQLAVTSPAHVPLVAALLQALAARC